MQSFFKIAVFCLVAVVTTAPVHAMANEDVNSLETGHHGPHIFEIFLGETYAEHEGHDEKAFSIGAQYRYAISSIMSVGILAEYSDSPFDAWVAGIPFVFDIGTTSWQVTAMPGIEFEGSKDEFLFRIGIGYEIDRKGGYSVKPEVNFDWVDGEIAVVAGATIGWRF